MKFFVTYVMKIEKTVIVYAADKEEAANVARKGAQIEVEDEADRIYPDEVDITEIKEVK